MWNEQSMGWQKKAKLDKAQVLSVERAVGTGATAVTWVVWPEPDG